MSRYLVAGTPLFLEVAIDGARVRDRMDPALAESIARLCDDAGAIAVPESCRSFMKELIERASEADQPWYRLLTLHGDGALVACVGFGQESGRNGVYHFYGAIAVTLEWLERAGQAWRGWLAQASARQARVEIDARHDGVTGVFQRQFDPVARIADFYDDGRDQLIFGWRPQ